MIHSFPKDPKYRALFSNFEIIIGDVGGISDTGLYYR